VYNVPLLNRWFAWGYNYFKGIEQKRATLRGESLSDEAFKFTWSYEQFLYDWVYAPNGKPSVDHGPLMSSYYQYFVDTFGDEGFVQAPLPDTCSYARWAKEGVCSGDYDGFGPLFSNADLTLRVTFRKCGEPSLPSMQIQCVGSACSTLSRPTSCSSNTQCPRGLVCRELNGPQMRQFNFDALYLAAIIEDRSSNYINDTKNVKCAGSSYFNKDVAYFLDKLGQTIPGSSSICQLNISTDFFKPGSTQVDEWVEKVYHGIKRFPGFRLILLDYFKSWA